MGSENNTNLANRDLVVVAKILQLLAMLFAELHLFQFEYRLHLSVDGKLIYRRIIIDLFTLQLDLLDKKTEFCPLGVRGRNACKKCDHI